jgi:hypothetical protein
MGEIRHAYKSWSLNRTPTVGSNIISGEEHVHGWVDSGNHMITA